MPINKNIAAENSAEREIVTTRTVNAPREKVFQAWTDPKLIVQWWGPTGFTTTIMKMEVKVGGVWRFVMHGPDGRDYQNKITYTEIVKPERIGYDHGGDDDDLEPVKFHTTVTFEDVNGQTKVTMRAIFPTVAERERVARDYGAVEGGRQCLARLDEHLTKNTAFVISREVNAPRSVVWKAWTDPEEMKKWWGPKGFTVIHSKMDLRPGGVYHYGMKSPDGTPMWGKFVFREILAPERLVLVDSFSDEKGGVTRHPGSESWPIEMLTTITFEEKNGKTTVTVRWLPLNASEKEWKTFDDNRPSMKGGWSGTFEQFEAYLAKR